MITCFAIKAGKLQHARKVQYSQDKIFIFKLIHFNFLYINDIMHKENMEFKNIFFHIIFKTKIFLKIGSAESFETSFFSSKASFSNFKLYKI